MAYTKIQMGIMGGLVKDLPPSRLGDDQWSTLHNVRIDNGMLITAGGHEVIHSPPPAPPEHTVGLIRNDVPSWYYATSDKLWLLQNDIYTDYSRATPYVATGNWDATVMNGVVYYNNGVDQLQVLVRGASSFADSLNFPSNLQAKKIVPFKNHLFALNLTENVDELPSSLRWSDPADVNAEPPSWDVADPTTTAGQLSLADTDGYLVDAVPLSDSLIIYKTDAVYSAQFIGGVFVFSFRALPFDNKGMLSSGCATVFADQHFVVGQDDIYIHDGVQHSTVADSRVRDFFFKDLNSQYLDSVFVHADHANNEVWICYPNDDSEGGACNTALVWDWEYNLWTTRDLPHIRQIARGIVDSNAADVWDTGSDTAWDGGDLHWDANRYSPDKRSMIYVSTFNGETYQKNGTPLFIDQPFEWVVEKLSVSHGDEYAIKMLNSISPRVGGEGSIDIRTGYQYQLGDGVSWSSPTSYSIGDFRHYTRNRGRYLSYRYSASSDVGNPLITSFEIEGALGGTK